MTNVQKVLRLQTRVGADGQIHISDPALQSGEDVEVIVLLPDADNGRRSALDILDEAQGGRVFETAADVDAYLEQERASWDD